MEPSGTAAAYSQLSLVPAGSPPRNTSYLPSVVPTRPTSPRYGRAQPLGQPVMRTEIGEAAGRDRRAAHGEASQRGQLRGQLDTMIAEQSLHRRAIGGRDARNDHVLLGRETQGGPEGLHQRAQGGAQRQARRVSDAAVLDVQAEEEVPVTLLVPAEVVLDPRPGDRQRILEREVQPLLYLLSKPR